MGKSSISPEVLKIIKKSIDEAVKKSAEAIKKANEEIDVGARNYFKEMERLLYSLPALRLKVAQDEEDLKNNLLVLKRRSTDVVMLSAGSSTHDPEASYIESRRSSMDRTKREIMRIERALETIEDDEYHDIIPLKYWDQLSPLEIADRLHCDERTYRRNKSRLVNKLKIVLFGADAL